MSRIAALLPALASTIAALHLGSGLAHGELPPGFVDEVIQGGFNLPVDACPDGAGRLFIAEKRGIVRVIQDGVLLPAPFIDLTAEVHDAHDKGLLGITLDPSFATNGWVYLLYNVDPIFGQPDEPGESASFGRLVRYTASGNAAIPSSRLILIGNSATDGIANCYSSHSIGTVAFGTDGSLFVGAGEGAHFDFADGGQDVSALDSQCAATFGATQDVGALRSQTLASLAGKILRLDPATGAGLPSNPFYDGNPWSFASRIWATGLRNPFRFTVRPDSPPPGTLYIGDVGWAYFADGYEELNVSRFGGENFGWPCWEGPLPQPQYQSSPMTGPLCQGLLAEDITAPILAWQHLDPGNLGFTGATISGVAFCRGSQFPPQYEGACFFSDYVKNWIRLSRVDALDQITSISDFASELGSPVDLEFDPETGELIYVAIATGQVRRIRFAAGNLAPFAAASATPQAGGAPLQVQLSSGGTFDPNGDPLILTWSFGDGTPPSHEANPQHTYTGVGTFTALLVATDPEGLADSASVVIETANLPPFAFITAPAHGSTFSSGERLTFRADAGDPEDGSALDYFWEVHLIHNEHLHPGWFTSTEPEPEFDAASHGGSADRFSYMIRLRVTDSAGLAFADTSVIIPSALGANRAPVANMSLTSPSGPAPHSVSLSAASSADPDNDYLFYNWSFGDGTMGNGPQATHVYSQPGLYTITLGVVDPVLAEDWTIASVLVEPAGGIATWRLNDNGGAMALDSSGNGNHAALSGGPAWVPGVQGSALRLDGEDEAGASGFGLLSNREAFSLCAWVRPISPGDRIGIVGQHGAVELGFLTLDQLHIRTAGGGSLSVWLPFPMGIWHHVAATGDGETLKLYYDGNLVQSAEYATSNYGASNYRLRFGGGGIFDPSGNHFHGSLDDVRVFSTAIPHSMIALYAIVPPSNHRPTVDAGADFAAAAGAFVPLIAEVTDDGLPAPPGQVTYFWSQESGPVPATIMNPEQSFTLLSCPLPGDYVFALRADDGALAHSDIVTVHAAIPTAVSGNSGLVEGLIRIEPNPARERTTLHFAVAREGTPVRMRIHDISGRFVATILDENFSSGSHRAQWNGRDGDGREAAAGVYFVVLEIGQRKDAGKLVFLR